MMYPRPYSIYLRGTIWLRVLGFGVLVLRVLGFWGSAFKVLTKGFKIVGIRLRI